VQCKLEAMSKMMLEDKWLCNLSKCFHIIDLNHHITMKKKGVLQLALQLQFLVIKDACNSLYLYVVSVNQQVA
jgi:hypothetical protein